MDGINDELNNPSTTLDAKDIAESREKAAELERKRESENITGRKKPAASAMPGSGSRKSQRNTENPNKAVGDYWQNEFHRQSVRRMNDSNDLPTDDAKLKERAASSGTGSLREPASKIQSSSQKRKSTRSSLSKSRSQPAPDGKSSKQDSRKAYTVRSSGEVGTVRGSKIEKQAPVPTVSASNSTRRPSVRNSATKVPASAENNDDEISYEVPPPTDPMLSSSQAAAIPGAYAHAGPGMVSDRRDSAVDEVLAALETADLDSAVSREPMVTTNSRSDLVSAEIIDDAETIFEASHVKHDQFRRNMLLMVLGCLVVGAVLVTVLMKALKKDYYICSKPATVPERCFCGNSTKEYYEHSLGEIGRGVYRSQLNFLVSQGVLESNDTTFDDDSCDVINQNLLLAATIAEENGTPEDFLKNASDEFKMAIFTLLHIYISMRGVKWINQDDWLTNEICSWFGAACVFIDTFNRLVLPENGLTGTLPTYLGFLVSIRTMDFSDNDGVLGPIPSEIGNMKSLHSLLLSELNLSGTIPSELSSIQKLDELNLNLNQLTGSIPRELYEAHQLRFLKVANNNLQGTLPTEIGSSTRLVEFDIGGNRLSGTLPSELEQLTYLELLSINNNNFSGTIPDFLGRMPHLRLLFLHESGLTGTIPETFCQNSTLAHRKIVIDCSTVNPECSCCSSVSNDLVNVLCFDGVPWLEYGDRF